MKKYIAIFVLLFSIINIRTYAQHWFRSGSLDFGVMAGFNHYSGDLTQTQFMESRTLRPNIGLITRYTPKELLTFRLSANYGNLVGDDRWYETAGDTTNRNLHFRSQLWDLTAAFEINLNRVDMRKPTAVIPYIFGGISIFRFNPQAQFNFDSLSPIAQLYGDDYMSLRNRDKEWIDLQPLSTEGQETTEYNERTRYALTQIAIPLGLGIKFKVNQNWVIGLEYGLRYTFTDYLDDVSTSYVEPDRLRSERGVMGAAMSYRGPNEITPEFEGTKRGSGNSRDLYGIFGIQITYRIYNLRPNCFQFK